MKNREYYTNGNLKAEYERNERGEKEGYELLYYESGVLRAEYHYKAGKLHGVTKEYYENGNLVAEGNYRNGMLEGLSRIYYESGKLKAESSYKNDALDGLCKMYYESGQVKAEYYYRDGSLEKTISSPKDNADVKVTDDKEFFDVDYEDGQLNLKLDLNTLLKSNLSKKDICKISYEDNELKLKIYDEDTKETKQIPIDKEKNVKAVQEEVKKSETKKVEAKKEEPKVQNLVSPKKETKKDELEIPSFLKSRYEDELGSEPEIKEAEPEAKRIFDPENDLDILEMVKTKRDADKTQKTEEKTELKFAKETEKKPKIKKIIKKIDSEEDEIADIRSILDTSDIDTEEEIVRNRGNKVNKGKKKSSTVTVASPPSRKKDSLEDQKKSVLKMIFFTLFLLAIGILFYFLYQKFTSEDTESLILDKKGTVAEENATEETDEESGADTEGSPEEVAAEAQKDENKEEAKAEPETKEKEVTKDEVTKDTKENAKAKEETKKEDKKEEVAKSSDNSDIKKIDEVISQVMDKKNPDYLLKFNSEELALIRNTLYARRGLKYTKGKYKDYFEGKSWYKPSVTSGKDLLPEKEERLVEIIRKYEKKAKK